MAFRHIAGDAMLDLLNTVSWRLGGADRQERLVVYADVLAWCAESELLSAEEERILLGRAQRDPVDAARERDRVASLREAAYALLIDGQDVAVGELARAYSEGVAAATLAASGKRWDWREMDMTLASPRHMIARGLIDLVRRADLDRLHQCDDAACGHVYLDTSPRRNRRWCDAKDCGDRNRARAYYARQRAARVASRRVV